MATILIKTTGVVGALGASGLAGLGIYKAFFSKITIKEAILSSAEKDSTYSFLDKDSGNWTAVKSEYAKVSSKNKPLRNGVEVSKDDLPDWCSTAVDSSFAGKEDAKYKSVVRWCYLSTNSFEQQAVSKNRELVKEKTVVGSTPAQEWKNAWSNKYKPQRDKVEWRITDEDVANLNKDVENDGATALKTWCEKKKSIFMYVEGAKDDFRKFLEFCTLDKQS